MNRVFHFVNIACCSWLVLYLPFILGFTMCDENFIIKYILHVFLCRWYPCFFFVIFICGNKALRSGGVVPNEVWRVCVRYGITIWSRETRYTLEDFGNFEQVFLCNLHLSLRTPAFHLHRSGATAAGIRLLTVRAPKPLQSHTGSFFLRSFPRFRYAFYAGVMTLVRMCAVQIFFIVPVLQVFFSSCLESLRNWCCFFNHLRPLRSN